MQVNYGPNYAELTSVYHNRALVEAETGDFSTALADLARSNEVAEKS
jgi:hypothetical protein